ncbi:MAG TPA: hypothetical protein VK787_05695 [Puia sp.]|jgi:hypothetical protein|nr:hypothetical protein [Puia sp.]
MKKFWLQVKSLLKYHLLQILVLDCIDRGFPGVYQREWKDGQKNFRETMIIRLEDMPTHVFSVSITLTEISGEKSEVEKNIKSQLCIGALHHQLMQIRLAGTGEYVTVILEQSCLFYKDRKYDKTQSIKPEKI